MKKEATWDTLLHFHPECYPTYKSREEVPEEKQVVIAQKIGDEYADQVIRVGDGLYQWKYGATDVLYCKVGDDYVWRGCGGFDY